MTKEIEELKEALAQALKQIKKLENIKTNKISNGERYYYVDADGQVGWATYYDTAHDKNRAAFGNVYLTGLEAQCYINRRKLEIELSDFSGWRYALKSDADYYVLYYDYTAREWMVGQSFKSPDHYFPATAKKIYFESEQRAEEAIEKFRDRLHLLLPEN